MTVQPVLTIVVVRDPAFRRALSARLAATGAVNLLVPEQPDAIARRPIRQPSILLTDEGPIAGDLGARIEHEWAGRLWRSVVVLTLDSPISAGEPDWQLFGPASAALSALLADWAAIDASPFQDKTGAASVVAAP